MSLPEVTIRSNHPNHTISQPHKHLGYWSCRSMCKRRRYRRTLSQLCQVEEQSRLLSRKHFGQIASAVTSARSRQQLESHRSRKMTIDLNHQRIKQSQRPQTTSHDSLRFPAQKQLRAAAAPADGDPARPSTHPLAKTGVAHHGPRPSRAQG